MRQDQPDLVVTQWKASSGYPKPFHERHGKISDWPIALSTAESSHAPVHTEAATRQERADLLPLWAGQAASLISHTTVESLMESLIRETNELYRNLSL
jgi:hypothetical protein